MNRKGANRTLESVGLWSALVILGIVAALAYRSIDATAETFGWVEHTYEVIQRIDATSSAYGRAVAARLSYVVAGDESHLVEAPELDQELVRAAGELQRSVSDNAGQVRRAEELVRLMQARIAELGANVERRRAGGPGGETAEGLERSARVREVREAIQREESRLLADRGERTTRDVRRTKLAVSIGTAASFVLLLLAFRRLRQEIQRRQGSEQALRTSESFLDSIIENLPTMIFVKEAGELRFERFNRAGEELLGVARTAMYGKNDFDFFPREQAEAFQARDRETLEGRAVVDIPAEPIDTSRGRRWLHTRKVPVLDEENRPKYLLGISVDITEEREAAEALRAAKVETEAANQELEAFSYAVAHDLRAPLRAIDGFSRALEEDSEGKLDATALSHLKRVRGATGQMRQLIDALLGLSRVTRGETARDAVDLSRLAEQSVTKLREANPERKVEVMVQPGLSATGDARLLGAALDNLIGNAWKFTSKQGDPRIEVGKEESHGEVVFFVRDNGAGFDPAFASKLFAAFQRLHGAAEFEGTGIGLATVQRIVRRHGGRVWAKGEVGRGATFYFTL